MDIKKSLCASIDSALNIMGKNGANIPTKKQNLLNRNRLFPSF